MKKLLVVSLALLYVFFPRSYAETSVIVTEPKDEFGMPEEGDPMYTLYVSGEDCLMSNSATSRERSSCFIAFHHTALSIGYLIYQLNDYGDNGSMFGAIGDSNVGIYSYASGERVLLDYSILTTGGISGSGICRGLINSDVIAAIENGEMLYMSFENNYNGRTRYRYIVKCDTSKFGEEQVQTIKEWYEQGK